MKLVTFLSAVSVASLVVAVASKAPLVNRHVPAIVPDSYVVVMKSGIDQNVIEQHYDLVRGTAAAAAAANGGRRGFVRRFQVLDFNAYHFECDNETIDTIRNHDLVDYVAFDGQVTTQAPFSRQSAGGGILPTSGVAASSWGLSRISHRLRGATSYVDASIPLNTEGGTLPQTRAYIVDTGIDIAHAEFGGRATWGATMDVDENGHGTHVAGTIGGNTVGVDNSTLLIAVKVFGGPGATGTMTDVMDGIQWAVNDAQNARTINRSVINMSLGGSQSQPLDDLVNSAHNAGMTVVVAAGNDGADACGTSPAAATGAITVAAIDETDTRAGFSNYGSCIGIFAPGTNINSTWGKEGDGPYLTLSGTSMASPHVAGLATYLMGRNSLQSPDLVWATMSHIGTVNMVDDAKNSPNLIAFNGNSLEP
ncbi:subtilisin-like protein [Xylariaceae sp. FL0016]|nr:subtilisin-like protein [Xylariaceae sp. FL0016]